MLTRNCHFRDDSFSSLEDDFQICKKPVQTYHSDVILLRQELLLKENIIQRLTIQRSQLFQELEDCKAKLMALTIQNDHSIKEFMDHRLFQSHNNRLIEHKFQQEMLSQANLQAQNKHFRDQLAIEQSLVLKIKQQNDILTKDKVRVEQLSKKLFLEQQQLNSVRQQLQSRAKACQQSQKVSKAKLQEANSNLAKAEQLQRRARSELSKASEDFEKIEAYQTQIAALTKENKFLISDTKRLNALIDHADKQIRGIKSNSQQQFSTSKMGGSKFASHIFEEGNMAGQEQGFQQAQTRVQQTGISRNEMIMMVSAVLKFFSQEKTSDVIKLLRVSLKFINTFLLMIETILPRENLDKFRGKGFRGKLKEGWRIVKELVKAGRQTMD